MKFIRLVFLLISILGMTSCSNRNDSVPKLNPELPPSNITFKSIYVDGSGLKWSNIVASAVSNGCLDENGVAIPTVKCNEEYEIGENQTKLVKKSSSDAEKECSKIGARLPTKNEFVRLIQDFENETTSEGLVYLTKKGIAELTQKIPDFKNAEWYWTSTLSEKYSVSAWVFLFSKDEASNDIAGVGMSWFRENKFLLVDAKSGKAVPNGVRCVQ